MEETSKSLVESSCGSLEDNDLDDVKHHIVNFFKWLDKIQEKNLVNSTIKDKNELLFLMLQLKKQLTHFISSLNILPSSSRQEFLCGVCSNKIILEPYQDIWECLEKHCHLNSCVKTSDLKEVQDESQHRKFESHSHTTYYKFPEWVLEKFHINLDILKKYKDNESGCESSTDEMSLKENSFSKEESESTEEYEKSEVAGTSSNIIDCNLSSSSTNDQTLGSGVPIMKSQCWYPMNSLTSSENLSYKDGTKTENFSNDEQVLPFKRNEISILFPTKGESNALGHPTTSEMNSFRFNFKSRYPNNLESMLYPKFYRKFDVDGDPVLQKTGLERTVCLSCCCELLSQKTPGNIVGHTSGAKHSQAVHSTKMRSIIKNYHDTFLRLDKVYQSHQIYFTTDDEGFLLRCVVCLKYVRCGDVLAHIQSEMHKSKLMKLGQENRIHSLFFFLKEHAERYGGKTTVSKDTNEEIEKVTRPNFMRHKIAESIDTSDSTWRRFLPGRFSKQIKYLQVKANSVSCLICDKGANTYSWKNIRHHLVQPSHLELAKTQMLNYLYHCDVCDKRFHDEISWIVHFNDEYKSHKEAEETNKNDKPLEYECVTCKVVLFGDSEAVNKHRQSNPIRRKQRNQAVSLNKEVKDFFSSKVTIRENAKQLLDDAESVVSKTDIVVKCCEDLENAIKVKYSCCKAYPFGSRVSGLGATHSDLDIFIDVGSMYNGDQNQDVQNQTLIISNVMNLIRKRREFNHINSRPTARTPIIQLKHKTTELECDISFVHGLSVENTKFLRYCFELQPVSQKLILLLKKWSSLCVLNENITTYALAMLGIFYLQKNNYLLSVQALKELNKRNLTIVGWETIDYVTPKEEILKHIRIFDGDLIELLIGFFKFYSDFNYKINVVCPLLGREIAKDLFSIDPKGGVLPTEMCSYVKKINTEKSPEYFRCLSFFCVQDPFDLSHNLTKACSSALLNKFVKLCSLTHTMLSNLED